MKLEIGSIAPEIEGIDQNNDPIKLTDFRGKKVILYFYPKDNTPGCTAQACNLRDNYELLQKNNYQVLGVSIDGVKSHKKFSDKFDLPFPLIVDEEKKIVDDYGVWGEKNNYGKTYMGTHRTTFVIDEKGVIEEIIQKVKTKEHTEQILK